MKQKCTQTKLTKQKEQTNQTEQIIHTEQSHECNDITFVDVKEEEDEEEKHDGPNVATNKNTVIELGYPNKLNNDRPHRNENKKKSKVDINVTKKKKKKQILAANIGETFSENKKQYICDKCNVVCLYPSRFIAHYRRSHLKQFERKICPYCPRAFTLSVTGMYEHRLYNKILNIHLICMSLGTSNLGRHIRTSHQNQMTDRNRYPTIKCTECNSIFCGPLEYYEHSKIHDSYSRDRDDGYNLVCDDCDINLESFDNFDKHMRVEHGITDKKDMRPVRCRWCGERCRNLLGLCTHIRIVHKFEGNGDDTIPSDMINKSAKGRGSTYLCMVCGKVLRSQSSYNHHMAAHSGEKQFSCDLCHAKFT